MAHLLLPPVHASLHVYNPSSPLHFRGAWLIVEGKISQKLPVARVSSMLSNNVRLLHRHMISVISQSQSLNIPSTLFFIGVLCTCLTLKQYSLNRTLYCQLFILNRNQASK